MKKINCISEIKKNDLIMFLDNNGSVRGFDQVLSIQGDHYSYKSLNKNRVFQGNLKTNLKKFTGYFITKEYVKYSNENFQSMMLGFEWVCEIIYGDFSGKVINSYINEKVFSNFENRVEMMNFLEENRQDIHKVRFNEEVGYTKEEFELATSIIDKEIQKLSFLNL